MVRVAFGAALALIALAAPAQAAFDSCTHVGTTVTDGRVATDTRTYRTCATKRRRGRLGRSPG